MTAIHWFREDLRLADNPALAAAAKSGPIIPLYILDDTRKRPMGAAQCWWLHHSLKALSESLQKKGAKLILQKGDPEKILKELIKSHAVDALYVNRSFDPAVVKRDAALLKWLKSEGVSVHTANTRLLTEPSTVRNKSGGYFKVYTPYCRHVNTIITERKILQAPRSITSKRGVTSDTLSQWKLLPTKPDWSKGFNDKAPGEQGAHRTLKHFLQKGLLDYPKLRDFPAEDMTSRLSPHLHFGELSPMQVWTAVKQLSAAESRYHRAAEAYLRQLIWREFAYYLLWHFPAMSTKNWKPAFNGFQWRSSQKDLRAWQKGLTGFPIVDAGMRELWHTGFMHNRVRMIVASFLTKDLLIDWRQGEKWFWDTLLDADPANNAMGWQWVAGSGPDAAPYFRIFNPTTQSQKFDPEGEYIRAWLPVLKDLPAKYIHCPEAAPVAVLTTANVQLGENYPRPIVDHANARQEALKRYKQLKG